MAQVRLKPIVPRHLAKRDVEDAIDYYLAEAGEGVASSFAEAVIDVYRAIASMPAAGSPRYAHELNLPGLRSRPIGRFPYLVFYIEQDDHIDVWRILHVRRDIPAWMSDPTE